jgi:hypothetical protein
MRAPVSVLLVMAGLGTAGSASANVYKGTIHVSGGLFFKVSQDVRTTFVRRGPRALRVATTSSRGASQLDEAIRVHERVAGGYRVETDMKGTALGASVTGRACYLFRDDGVLEFSAQGKIGMMGREMDASFRGELQHETGPAPHQWLGAPASSPVRDTSRSTSPAKAGPMRPAAPSSGRPILGSRSAARRHR